MRYRELCEARPWKHFEGRNYACRVVSCGSITNIGRASSEVTVQIGNVYTGKQKVFSGWFVKLALPSGEVKIVEDRYFLRGALRKLEDFLNAEGWSLNVIGLDPEWRESGLSANSGHGFHSSFERAVHMLEPRSNPST